MGPIAVKTYPGEEWKKGRNRATFEPDYGRRGKLWIHGAFEPATGQAAMVLSPSRDSASHIQLLEKIITQFPADRWLIEELQGRPEGFTDGQRLIPGRPYPSVLPHTQTHSS